MRIFLAIDHTILRTGLRILLEREPDLEVVGEASDGQDLVRLVNAAQPDILVIDLHLPGCSGIEVLQKLAARGTKTKTLLLATEEDKDGIAEAFGLGAEGIVLKESDSKVLVNGIRSIMKGSYWAGNRPEARIEGNISFLADLGRNKGNSKTYGLTKREFQIISRIVSGYSNREIANKLSISEETVKHHLTNIFDKVGVYNRLELALFAIHHGLVGGQ